MINNVMAAIKVVAAGRARCQLLSKASGFMAIGYNRSLYSGIRNKMEIFGSGYVISANRKNIDGYKQVMESGQVQH